jgi:CheY-like chemotaxis protein
MTPPTTGDCILVAEDEPTDAFILRQAFLKSGLPARLEIVRDGQEAVEYLDGEGPYADRNNYPLPRLLLLDLKMPRMTGFDVLAWLSEKPQFNELPRVVLSSSSHESDVRRALDLGALDYFIKPVSLAKLTGLLQQLHARWLSPSSPSSSNDSPNPRVKTDGRDFEP